MEHPDKSIKLVAIFLTESAEKVTAASFLDAKKVIDFCWFPSLVCHK